MLVITLDLLHLLGEENEEDVGEEEDELVLRGNQKVIHDATPCNGMCGEVCEPGIITECRICNKPMHNNCGTTTLISCYDNENRPGILGVQLVAYAIY